MSTIEYCYFFYLGAPARKLAVGLSAHSPRQARRLPCLWAIRYNPWREGKIC